MPPPLARAVAARVAAALGAVPRVPAGTLALGDPALLELTMAQAAARYGVPADAIPRRRRGAESAPGLDPKEKREGAGTPPPPRDRDGKTVANPSATGR